MTCDPFPLVLERSSTNDRAMKRTDRASRVVRAAPESIYRVLLDPSALVKWLPPKGMRARLEFFEPRVGGRYRMILAYEEKQESRGKTSENEDVVAATFVELVPNERVVQRVEFESEDPAFADPMKMTWSLTAAAEGTDVTIVCEDVPEGIAKEDHDAGLKSTLENLAAFVE